MHPSLQSADDSKVGEPSAPANSSPSTLSCLLITSLDQDFVVQDMDSAAMKRIGQVLGRSLVSADWVAGAARMLQEWGPYGCQLDSVSEDGVASKIFCQLFPFRDEEVFAGSLNSSVVPRTDSGLGGGYSPNRVLWTMQECPVITDEVQIATMIRFLIKRVVDAAILRIERSHDGMQQCPNVCDVINHAENLFNSDDDPLNADDPLIDLMDKFLQWVKGIEGCLWNCHQIEMLESCNKDILFDTDRGHNLLSDSNVFIPARTSALGAEDPKLQGSTLEKEYFATPSQAQGSVYSDTAQQMHINLRRSGSTEPSNNLDLSILADMSSSLDMFFAQLREVAIIPHIVGLLRTVKNVKAAFMVEEFINYCQTKHTHPRVRELMKEAQDYVRSHKLEKAIEALDEVCYTCDD
jgi:hypothetical protein